MRLISTFAIGFGLLCASLPRMAHYPFAAEYDSRWNVDTGKNVWTHKYTKSPNWVRYEYDVARGHLRPGVCLHREQPGSGWL